MRRHPLPAFHTGVVCSYRRGPHVCSLELVAIAGLTFERMPFVMVATVRKHMLLARRTHLTWRLVGAGAVAALAVAVDGGDARSAARYRAREDGRRLEGDGAASVSCGRRA